MSTTENITEERRQYVRLNSVFPVEFQIMDANNEKALSSWMEGFTSNISRGGMRLILKGINAETVALLTKKDIQLSLSIRIPLTANPTEATAQVIWLSKVEGVEPVQYHMGIKYLMIEREGFKRIMRYAHWCSFKGWLSKLLRK